ncbi:3'-5' exonuclease [Alkaliphilus peptidifermentans]|uniref:Inhibitor of the KinA pathway to sporulation, predicted exonuclease n=1 Tax=Alkaliphilus peptidifermentans DSM 18978 TaxID=1120976 RepID=A0A1G5DQR8_9FIRM|nr:3'-5' exonuclease [Alkaliphilus peptidifermentans]SCY17099.1 Inhibitor of the KinA pathway to sporulation, predicted exonuclease [Alkaliphilus peptidifermentans DSM 18978]
MKYIIFDLEFNSAFKIDRRTKKLMRGNTNPLCPQEIIEIGAVKVNSEFDVIDTFKMFVKPQLYIKVHPKVKQKTGITKEDLLDGISLEDAIESFKGWIEDDDFILCSWGQDDIKELKRNCEFFKIEMNWIKRYCDIQRMCMEYLELPKGMQIGLKKAVEMFNIDVDNKFHKALNDSIYTSKVLKAFNNENSKIHEIKYEN